MAAASINSSPAKAEEQNLIVALRTRPLNDEEILNGATTICHCVDNKMVVLLDPQEDPDDILRANRTREKQFVFDHALDGTSSQEEVYQKTSQYVIPSVIQGYNATVFAYGATGAGKTYTMLGTDHEPGIMARSLNDLFREMERCSEDYAYSVSMTYLEIYNEMIRDLLNPETGYLELREDSKGVQVPGIKEVDAHTSVDVMQMLLKGNKERTQEPTAANKTSSRSHAVLQVNVKQRPRVHGTIQEVRTGKLFLIDLAGSERAAATHNRGKRMVEGAHINRSLLALGNCINALSDKNGAKYVNFRDSKLTRLLKDSLGGNCKTVMIAHVGPASLHFEETRNTLLYAERARNIKTKVKRNVMDVQYHIHQYTNIIAELREEVKRLRIKLDKQALNSKNSSAIQAIQTEVLQASQREDESGLNRLKEQLVTVFRDQMDLRRSLMELDNTAMEIRLETARNLLLVQKSEKERALAKRRREREKENINDAQSINEKDEDDENPKDATKEKDLEKSQSETDDVEEPEEVKNARYDLIALAEEKGRTERLKAAVSKELENSREKASKIEELLPKRVNSSEQQEILSLLVKVHELEIDNMEMQSSCLLRNFEIRRKNMVLVKYQQHLSLCDEIIQQQKSLLDEYMVTSPKELDELYELYGQEDDMRPESVATSLPDPFILNKGLSMTSLNRRVLESDSMSDLERLTVLNEEQSHRNRLLAPAAKRPIYRNMKPPPTADDDKIFSRSAKAQEIRAAQAQDGDAISLTALANNVSLSRQRSIITLSSHTTSPTPPADPTSKALPLTIRENKVVDSQREVIASKTRNIAALAAARKNKAHLNAYNNERLATFASLQGRDNVLTTSRLAQHDEDYSGSEITLNHLIDDDATNGTNDDSAKVKNTNPQPVRGRYRSNVHSRTSTQPPARKPVTVKKRSRSQDISNYPVLSPQSFFRQSNRFRMGRSKQLSKTTPPRRANDTTGGSTNLTGHRQRIIPAATKTGFVGSNRAYNRNEDIREFESAQTPPISVRQSNADKGRGLMIQKRVRGPAFGADKSTARTPRKGRTSKRPPPSIPAAYRKTDIAIAGFGLQK